MNTINRTHDTVAILDIYLSKNIHGIKDPGISLIHCAKVTKILSLQHHANEIVEFSLFLFLVNFQKK